jgi:hypothetical protein
MLKMLNQAQHHEYESIRDLWIYLWGIAIGIILSIVTIIVYG